MSLCPQLNIKIMKEQFEEKQWVKPKTWDEFRGTGLFMFVNTILHAFGWALCADVAKVGDKEVVTKCYPSRVRFRGFSSEDQDEMHTRIADHLANQAPNFPEEIK